MLLSALVERLGVSCIRDFFFLFSVRSFLPDPDTSSFLQAQYFDDQEFKFMLLITTRETLMIVDVHSCRAHNLYQSGYGTIEKIE